MIDQHPDILYTLHKIRAQEYQEDAANLRLVFGNREKTKGLGKKLVQIGRTLFAGLSFLGSGQPKPPASLAVAQTLQKAREVDHNSLIDISFIQSGGQR